LSLNAKGDSEPSSSEGEPAASPANYDAAVAKESDAAEASRSPLRLGKGFVLGAYFDLRWNTPQGGDPLYGFGITPRYSLSRNFALGAELGFSGSGTIGSDDSVSGPRALLFGEGRFSINDSAKDAIFVALGAGYERYTQSGFRVVLNAPLVRGKVGYRHVFGSRVGLEVGALADVMFLSTENAPVNASSTEVLVGGATALTVGF
jgi:hypothetical protein